MTREDKDSRAGNDQADQRSDDDAAAADDIVDATSDSGSDCRDNICRDAEQDDFGLAKAEGKRTEDCAEGEDAGKAVAVDRLRNQKLEGLWCLSAKAPQLTPERLV